MNVFKDFGNNFVKMINSVTASPVNIISSLVLIFFIAAVYFFILKILKSAEAKLLIGVFVTLMVLGAAAVLFDGIESVLLFEHTRRFYTFRIRRVLGGNKKIRMDENFPAEKA